MQNEYHKIHSVYKRDEKTHKFIDEYSRREFPLISSWVIEEKIDGTNIRVHYDPTTKKVEFGGKTDNAQIPGGLYKRLVELFPSDKFTEFDKPVTLYGEGVGKKIQKGGHLYCQHLGLDHDFILFDVMVNGVWCGVDVVTFIAESLGIRRAAIMGVTRLELAESQVRGGFLSEAANHTRRAEGLVLKTYFPLFDAQGNRIITKLKFVDFN